MSEETPVLFDLSENIATITLNRPQVFNAFTPQLHRELTDALKRAERDDAVRAIIITGAGRAFCSGQDLKSIPLDGDPDLANTIRNSYNPLIQKLRTLNKPIIAAVNGVAAGAGFSLTLACDFRIASEEARFVAAFANIGLVPDSGMTFFLPRLIGHARAVELCMTGGTLDAATAYSYGMLNALVPADQLTTASRELAARLANGPAQAISLMKRAFELSLSSTLETVLEYEAQAQQVAGTSPEFVEGVTAFREKRKPDFRSTK